MTCRCGDVGLNEVFNERFMRRDAQHYRKHGLEKRARLLLQLVEASMNLPGSRSLEGGAGAGALTVELARRGVSAARAVDAQPVAIQYARELAGHFDVLDRAHFELGDFADPALSAEPADLVVLDRVVCCYPDWRALLSNAAQRADQVIALTYPRENRLTRIMIRTFNRARALFRKTFRVQLHSPAAMLALLHEHGFTNLKMRRHWMWEIAVLSR